MLDRLWTSNFSSFCQLLHLLMQVEFRCHHLWFHLAISLPHEWQDRGVLAQFRFLIDRVQSLSLERSPQLFRQYLVFLAYRISDLGDLFEVEVVLCQVWSGATLKRLI